MMYGSQDIRPKRRTKLFVILDYFLPFYPSEYPENHSFDKMKKILGDIIILHMCTINKAQLSIFFVTLGQFKSFYPLTT